MDKKTLYDILELNEQASNAAIRAAYERLSQRYDPDRSENARDPDAALQYNLVREAFLTLANEAKRKAYDESLARGRNVAKPVIYAGAGTGSKSSAKLLVLLGLALAAGAYFYNERQEAVREIARAAEQTRQAEAEALARRAEEEHYAEWTSEHRQALDEARRRSEFEQARRDADRNMRDRVSQEDRARRAAEAQQRRDEAQRQREYLDAQRRAERDKAYARQLEYENSRNRKLNFQ